ncbi:UDP-N-acetylmuramoyl-tripeptide--D-alanyl-D-alanine ligase [Thalassotalea mangrovi]|uniref:UDP-N-acetylmuramoyl-tripeptide--D-alanyl-D-alanine ligase n=1 Tax=Thalassotalea mangrovi TaxID=2572245 RepID=A0A4U1BA35_9GAMM|nr:UDP-N-acetylmuramoyl-tripeptide--D-alanyl-D-alanine ligase [Thalassotalea mangrovi]TKB47672.1 UDP-N-acetylmuramoyl-tripeptide--D-alanyl-D-alanine ligase [Thalassotalea mangrovi]
MITLTLSEIAAHLDATLLGADIQINSVSTDTRQLAEGDLFIALKGPNFDAHDFIEQAEQAQCAAVIVEKQQQLSIPQLIVADTHKALGQLGALVKARVNPKTLAITGSNGKTTVKEMSASILSQLGKVLATAGNFNNDIGAPLTLLRLSEGDEYAVIELGANHLGEIAYTTNLAKPDVAMINNIAAAHLEGFGDLNGVARAKGEIFDGLGEIGVGVYNFDTPYADKWLWRLQDKTVKTFSGSENQQQADYFASDIQVDPLGCASFILNGDNQSIAIRLPLPGLHNVSNAVAAATVCIAMGANFEQVKQGLEGMQPVKGRLNLQQLPGQLTLIDDTYNANVESARAAVELLTGYQGRTILILGDMAELGEDARIYHQEIGEYARQKGIDNLLTLGVLSQSTSDVYEQRGRHFSSRELLLDYVKQLLDEKTQPTTILVKGSRSARMELVVADIANWRRSSATGGASC